MNIINRFKTIYNQILQMLGTGKAEKLISSFPNFFADSISEFTTAAWVRQYEGKLLLRQEIDLTESIFQHYVKLRYFQAVPSIVKTITSKQCMRCFNRRERYFASIHCKRCQRIHIYCRHCIEMGRVLECEPLYIWKGPVYDWEKHEHPLSWRGQLTKIQQKAADEIAQCITKRNKMLVWAVTGSGKTEMLFLGLKQALQSGKRICIASPRADVVRELVPRIQAAFQNVSVQGLYTGSADKSGTAQLIIATTHQLYRYRNAFDVMIIDEIDAFPFHADFTLQKAAERACRKWKRSVIYLTATPRKKQKWQMLNGSLPYTFVPTRHHGSPLIIPQWTMQSSIVKDLSNHTTPIAIRKWFLQRASTRQILVFVPTISLLSISYSVLKSFLLKENLLSSASKIAQVHAGDVNREEKVAAFRSQEITVLLTTTILERGVTFPSIDVLVIDSGHIVFDEAALTQIAGRAGRSMNDPTGEVVFFYKVKTKAMIRTNQSMQEMNQLQQQLRGDM